MSKKPKTGLEICSKCAMWSYCAHPAKVNDMSSKINCLFERQQNYDEIKRKT